MPRKPAKPKVEVQTNDEALARLAALQGLLVNEGWKVLVEEMEKNLAVLGNQIIKKVDLDGKTPISDGDADRLRDKHGYLSELKELPERLMAFYRSEDPEKEDFDPYPKTRS